MPVAYDRREDAELLSLARKEPEAFAAFYRRHVDRVLAFSCAAQAERTSPWI